MLHAFFRLFRFTFFVLRTFYHSMYFNTLSSLQQNLSFFTLGCRSPLVGTTIFYHMNELVSIFLIDLFYKRFFLKIRFVLTFDIASPDVNSTAFPEQPNKF